MGIAPMSIIDNPKSSTSLVYFNVACAAYAHNEVGNKQNLHLAFPELFRQERLKNHSKLFS